MKKYTFLTSLAVIGMVSAAYAATPSDVTFGGNFKISDGTAVNVADELAAATYEYKNTAGDTVSKNYDEAPNKSEFTFVKPDNTIADISVLADANARPKQSEYKDVTSALVDADPTASQPVTTHTTLIAGETLKRSEYKYLNYKDEAIELGDAAMDIVDTHIIENESSIFKGYVVEIKNGKAVNLDGASYKFTLDDTEYHLSADGNRLVSGQSNITPEADTQLETEFNKAKAMYLADKAEFADKETNTASLYAAEQARFNAANAVYEEDKQKLQTLTDKYNSIANAENLYQTALAAKSDAETADSVNRAALTAAKDVYNAPILATIESGANSAIDNALKEEGVISVAIADEAAARAAADEAVLGQAKAYADAQNTLTLKAANDYTDQKVGQLEKEVSAGIASATALSSVAVSNVGKGEVSVGGGYGYYNSQSAVAFGAAMGLTDNWSVNAGAGLSDGNVAFRAGTNYKFKLF